MNPTQTPARMPRLATWAYVFSFLLSPVGLALSLWTFKKYRGHGPAQGLAFLGLLVSACYLGLFTLIRIKY